MLGQISFILLSVALLIGMWFAHEVGRSLGLRHKQRHPDADKTEYGAVLAAVLALLGLLLGFAFAGAASRLETRRQHIIQEANDIGTAWLRLDLLQPADREALRDLFRQYLDARIRIFHSISDRDALNDALREAADLQGRIWTAGVGAARRSPETVAPMLLIPALNSMIDMATTRNETARMHIPWLVLSLLCGVALLSAALAGYGGADRERKVLPTIVFGAVVTVTVYVILDLEHPRYGLISLEDTETVLLDLRQSLMPAATQPH